MIKRALVALPLLAGTANAHDWYDRTCCSGADCQPAPINSVELTDKGYFVRRGVENPLGVKLQQGRLVPFNDKRIRPMPPGAPAGTGMHICTNSQQVLCIYLDSGI